MAFSPLVFNVNDYTGRKMEESDNAKFRIGTRQFINRISSQVSNELQIIEIQPDSLYFEFDRIVKRKVKVKPNITYELKKQYYVSGEITTDPDSVVVAGAQSLLDTLQYVYTKFQHYTDLDKNIQRNVQLEVYVNSSITPKRVILKIPLEEFTEKQLIVPVRIVDVPDSLLIKPFPDKVKVSFMVGLSHFSEITAKDFRFTVSYSDIAEKKEMLPISLEANAQNIRSVSFVPEQVEYLIEKKQDD